MAPDHALGPVARAELIWRDFGFMIYPSAAVWQSALTTARTSSSSGFAVFVD